MINIWIDILYFVSLFLNCKWVFAEVKHISKYQCMIVILSLTSNCYIYFLINVLLFR